VAKLSEERIIEIIKCYDEIGTYSGVAKKLSCSAATVKKYVMLRAQYEEVIQKQNNIIRFDGKVLPVEEVEWSKKYSEMVILSEEEIKEIQQLWEEI
jgi:hypothetical protein